MKKNKHLAKSCVTIIFSTHKHLINNNQDNKINGFYRFGHNSFQNNNLDDFSMP
jgi:hypothetical protein